MDLLDDVYIDMRYPGSLGLLPSGFPTREQSKHLVALAERVLKAAQSCLE